MVSKAAIRGHCGKRHYAFCLFPSILEASMLEKRGRKSTADLESADIVSPELPGSRPEPPLDLSPEEAAVWRNAVGCMPARWFGRERQLVLRGYVAHVVAADHAWKMYEAALHDPRTPAKELGRL